MCEEEFSMLVNMSSWASNAEEGGKSSFEECIKRSPSVNLAAQRFMERMKTAKGEGDTYRAMFEFFDAVFTATIICWFRC